MQIKHSVSISQCNFLLSRKVLDYPQTYFQKLFFLTALLVKIYLLV